MVAMFSYSFIFFLGMQFTKEIVSNMVTDEKTSKCLIKRKQNFKELHFL